MAAASTIYTEISPDLVTNFHNLGALTSTFTAAPSCVTSGPKSTFIYGPDDHVDCGFPTNFAGCIPSGIARDSSISSLASSDPLALIYSANIDYYSPGLICPSGWTTAGVATKTDSDKATSTGVVFGDGSYQWAEGSVENYVPNAVLDFLTLNQTAIACCPSSYTGNFHGLCTSSLTDYKVSTACVTNIPKDQFTYFSMIVTELGTTWSGTTSLYTGNLTAVPTSTRTYGSEYTYGLYPISISSAIYMIHKSSDLNLTYVSSTASDTLQSSSTANSAGNAGLRMSLTGRTGGFTMGGERNGMVAMLASGIGVIMGATLLAMLR